MHYHRRSETKQMRLLVTHGFIRGGDLLDWFGVLVIVDTGAGAGLLVEGDD